MDAVGPEFGMPLLPVLVVLAVLVLVGFLAFRRR